MKKQAELFRRSANRFCVFFDGLGLVPVAESRDDSPVLLTGAPRRLGDDVLIQVEGQVRRARWLASSWSIGTARYLVDMGPANDCRAPENLPPDAGDRPRLLEHAK